MSDHTNVITEAGRRQAHVEALQSERDAVAARPGEGAGKDVRERRLREIDEQLSEFGQKPNGRGGKRTATNPE